MDKLEQVVGYINYSARYSHDNTQLWIRYLNKMIRKKNPDHKLFLETLAKYNKSKSGEDLLYELDSDQHILVGLLFKSNTFYNMVINLDQKVDTELVKVKVNQLLTDKEVNV